MNSYRLVHVPSRRVVAVVGRADSVWAKGWGVLGRSRLPQGEGLWLPGVASVHTAFLRFPLDLLFLDRELRMVRLAPQTPAWQWLVRAPGAVHTVELGAGTLARNAPDARVGERWAVERVEGRVC